jgi:isocitrate/isopropylmalate dehydrogenase
MSKDIHRIVAIPGEGIGLEVVEAALTILKAVAQQHNFTVQIDYGVIGKAALEEYGSYFPEETAQLCENSDGILFGAVNQGGLLELRQKFDFFANLRPVKTHPCLLNKSSLKPEILQDVELVVSILASLQEAKTMAIIPCIMEMKRLNVLPK